MSQRNTHPIALVLCDASRSSRASGLRAYGTDHAFAPSPLRVLPLTVPYALLVRREEIYGVLRTVNDTGRVVTLPKQEAKCVPALSQPRPDARRARGNVRRHRDDPTPIDMQGSRCG